MIDPDLPRNARGLLERLEGLSCSRYTVFQLQELLSIRASWDGAQFPDEYDGLFKRLKKIAVEVSL